jgi:hypothetical protein
VTDLTRWEGGPPMPGVISPPARQAAHVPQLDFVSGLGHIQLRCSCGGLSDIRSHWQDGAFRQAWHEHTQEVRRGS